MTADQGLLAVLTSDMEPLTTPFGEGLLNLDLAGDRLAPGCPPSLGAASAASTTQSHSARSQAALKMAPEIPGVCAAHKVGGPEPQPKLRVGAVHHRPAVTEDLLMALRALPQLAMLEHPGPLLSPAGRTAPDGTK